MSDDEGRLIIDDPNSPENKLYISESPRKNFLNLLKEMDPCGVSLEGNRMKETEEDGDKTPPLMMEKEWRMESIKEGMEEGEISDDEETDSEEQKRSINDRTFSAIDRKESISNNRKSPPRETKEVKVEKAVDANNERSHQPQSQSERKEEKKEGRSHHHYPHSRGAPGGVRSKPDPLSLCALPLQPAGHLRRSIDSERKASLARHFSLTSSSHSYHSTPSSSTTTTPLPTPSILTPSSLTAAAHAAFPAAAAAASTQHPLAAAMALDVSTAPSPALSTVPPSSPRIERGERNGERKEEKSNGPSCSKVKEEEDAGAASSCSSEGAETTAATAATSWTMKRKREVKEEEGSVEPSEKKRRPKEEREEREEEEEKEEGERKMMVSRGTCVNLQLERDEGVMHLPAGSNVTLTLTIVGKVERGDQADGGVSTIYFTSMVGGREMTGVLTDAECALGLRRKSQPSSSSTDESNRNGTPSKSYRGSHTTPRDKRAARNGVERKRRARDEEDEEVIDPVGGVSSSSLGEGPSGGMRMEMREKERREMHPCGELGCEYRFDRWSELQYHKEEMHRRKKALMDERTCQTMESSFRPRPSMECQTERVVVRTDREEREREEKEKEERRREREMGEKKPCKKCAKAEARAENGTVKQNGQPALTIQTGPSAFSVPTNAATPPTSGLLMKASPAPAAAAATAAADATAAMQQQIAAAVSNGMPHLTPSLPSKSSRLVSNGTAVPSPRTTSASSSSAPHPHPPPMAIPHVMPGQPGMPPMMPQFLNPYAMQMMAQQQQHHQQQQQQRAAQAAASNTPTQHKINELKVKHDDATPSTSSGHGHHIKAAATAAIPSPAAVATPQRMAFPMPMAMATPQSHAQMAQAAQMQFMQQMQTHNTHAQQHMIMNTLMSGGQLPQKQPSQQQQQQAQAQAQALAQAQAQAQAQQQQMMQLQQMQQMMSDPAMMMMMAQHQQQQQQQQQPK